MSMKKILLTLAVVMAACFAASAQKFALVDMEYILKQVPSYEMANEQLRQLSQRWQKEVEAVTRDADAMYKKYLSDKVFLTEDQVKKREEEIVAKEKQASELRYKYFGPEGELFKKRTSLMTPIQEEIYNAVKDIADMRGYSLVIDRASDTGIVFGSPKIDISNEVLRKLGYSN